MPFSSLPFLSFLSGGVALDKTPALCDEAREKWTSYGDLRAKLKTLAPLWHRDGVGRSLILCAAPRTTNGVIAFLSACASGHAVFPIDPGIVRLAPFISAYDPEWIVSASSIKPTEDYDAVEWALQDLFLWRRAQRGEADINPELFLLLLPPGPEGHIRTVRLSYKSIAANIEASCEALGVTAQDRAILHLPLSFTLGFLVLSATLTVGGSLLLTEADIKDRNFWDAARQREATLFPGIPFHYDYIARAGLENLKAPRLRVFWQAGGTMQQERLQELLRQIEPRKGKFFVLFGQAETGRIAVLPAQEFPEKSGSVGRALRNGEIRIEDGEILYKGPTLMMGYASSREDMARGAETMGFFRTGERGFLDNEGFLHLTR